MKKYFLYFLATLLAVCSCGSAQGESEFVRQVALPDADGFVVSEGPLASPVDALLKRDQLHFQSDRGSPELSREFVSVLEWFEESLGRFPVLLTVPVKWVPEGALAGGRNVLRSRAVRQQRQQIDNAVEAVRKALFASSNYSRSSIDYSEYKRLYKKWQNIEDGSSFVNPGLIKPGSSSQLRWRPRSNESSYTRNVTRGSQLSAADYFASFQPLPGLKALVNTQELRMLLREGLVAGVQLDQVVLPQLAESTGAGLVASAELSEFLGVDGRGTTVAIMDTGTYLNHPAFQNDDGTSKIVSEGCFVNDNTCPNGTGVDLSPGSSTPCVGNSWFDLDGDNFSEVVTWPCDHGTHVAGIAVGNAVLSTTVPSGPAGVTTPPATPSDEWHAGVAPGADLMSIRIADNDGSSAMGLYINAWNWVAANAVNLNVVSVNLSFGNQTLNAVACDNTSNDQSQMQLATAAIANLVSLNIAPTIASGNDGFRLGVASPGCFANAVTVGNSDKSDVIAPTSNFGANMVDLYAPGTSIVAASGVASNPAIPQPTQATPTPPGVTINGGLAADGGLAQGSLEYEFKSGTSMAAPHVAGAWALLRQKMPNANVATLLALLQATGVPIIDNRPGNPAVVPPIPAGTNLAASRIDLEAALLEDTKPLAQFGPWQLNVPFEDQFDVEAEQEIYRGARKTFSQGTGLTPKSLALGSPVAEWEGNISLKGSPVDPLSAHLDKAFFYFSTQNALANSIEIAGNTYVLGAPEFRQVGYSKSPCQNDQFNPMRSYRVDITSSAKGLVKGNNTVKVQVTNSSGIVDGASILLISKSMRRTRNANEGGVVLVHGASVLDGDTVATASFAPGLPFSGDGLTMDGRAVRLHVGVADGQNFYESGLWFQAGNETDNFNDLVTGPSLFSGSDGGTDGSHWDDITFNLDDVGLFGIPYLVRIGHYGHQEPAEKDCLGWIYGALNIYPGRLRSFNTIPGLKAGDSKSDQQPDDLDISEMPEWAPTKWELEYMDPSLIPVETGKAQPIPPLPNG